MDSEISIDLQHLTEEDSFLLGKLFSSHKNIIDVFTKGTEYRIWHDNKIKVIKLSHDVLYRPSNKNKNDARYEVVNSGKVIGKGGFSEIFDILFTIVPQANGSVICKKNNKRVVKVQIIDYEELETLTSEVELSEIAGNLRIKKPAIIGYSKTACISYTVMRYLPGSDFFTILDDLNRGKLTITTLDRINISIKLLIKLQELHLKGIIHRDIKPENIMYDLITQEMHILDFGLSKMRGEVDEGRMVGTPCYAPPEVYFQEGTNEKSDLFSMAIVVGLLWYADMPTDKYEKIIDYNFNNIFGTQQIELDDIEKKKIKDSLLSMIRYPRDTRISVEVAIRQFQAIRDSYIAKHILTNKFSQQTKFSAFVNTLDETEDDDVGDYEHFFQRMRQF